MHIAHIGNISGVASILAKEQQQHLMGHTADVFVFDDLTKDRFGGIKVNYNSFIEKNLFYIKLKFYDIWHYHYPYGSLFSYLKKHHKKKIFLKHYHGSDLRDSGNLDTDFCLVATPDLLKYAPNAKWLPNPIDIDELKVFNDLSNLPRENEIPLISHYPYYINRPETDYFSSALHDVETRRIASVTRIINFNHKETLERIANSDIVLGKIMPDVGWFGKFELEGMALGKPVLAYVSDELYEIYKPPIFRTTKETFKKDLLYLIDNPSERKRLSLEGKQYIKKNHDSEIVIKKLFEYYNILKNL